MLVKTMTQRLDYDSKAGLRLKDKEKKKRSNINRFIVDSTMLESLHAVGV